MGLIGPNGAGKTTTIKILMNMVRADGGDVRVCGLDPRKDDREIKNRVGYVGENHYFYGDRSVAWTEAFVSGIYARWDTNRFNSLLMKFAVSRTKKTRELSKGMKVKLSLAMALSHEPEFLILDEPTAGLDPVIRREVLELLMRMSKEEEKSVLISSHITDDIARIADYVAFLVDGKVVLAGEKDEILSNWKRIHYKDGALAGPVLDSLTNRTAHMFGKSGVTSRFLELRGALADGMASEDIKVENLSLDDILISYVKGDSSCGRS
jgi:ABC-2 type transport system ATP-binding protein